MNIKIDSTMLSLYSKIIIGIVIGEITDAKKNLHQDIGEMQKKALDSINLLCTSTLTSHPHIAAWRETYKKFGVKAKRHNPTHEALVRRLIKKPDWPEINPIVDIYLTNQVEYILPHGGYDSKKIQGDLLLSLSEGNEPFYPLGGGEELTDTGEVVYKDDSRTLTRKWNYRDNEHTKITDETKSFILMIESASEDIDVNSVKAATDGLVAKYEACFNGRFVSTIIDSSKETMLDFNL